MRFSCALHPVAHNLMHMSSQPVGIIPAFELNDRLRKAREHSGHDQGQLAEIMGVSRGTISNAERATHGVRPIVVKMWAMATGVDARWLETGQAPHRSGGPQSYTARDSNSEPIDLESPRVLTLVAA